MVLLQFVTNFGLGFALSGANDVWEETSTKKIPRIGRLATLTGFALPEASEANSQTYF